MTVAPDSSLDRVELMGMGVHAVSECACVDHVLCSIAEGRGGWIITANLDHLRRFQSDPEYRGYCASADLVVPDGRPMLWAAWLQGTPLPGQVAGSNLVYSIAEGAARSGRSILLVGGEPGTAEAAGCALVERYPGLRIAGTYFPAFGFEKDPDQVEALRTFLAQSGADIVYMALGSPKQERLIARFRDELPAAWWIGVGYSLSFLAGEARRAPQWIQRLGFEWLHRLAHEPRRLFKRYIVLGLPFASRLFAGAIWKRICTRLRGRGRG